MFWICGEGLKRSSSEPTQPRPAVVEMKALLSATARSGSIILYSASGAADIYIETGTAIIFEAADRGQPAKAGQFFTRRPPKHVVVGNRPDGEFLASMPQPFRDTLPSRLSHFAGKKAAEPKHDHDVTYAEVEPWLKLGTLKPRAGPQISHREKS